MKKQLAAAAVAAALGLTATSASAGVIAYSALSVTNLRVDSGDINVSSVDNGGSSGASFIGVPGVSNSDSSTSVGGGSDAALSCVGACNTGENVFTQTAALGGPNFARGDSQQTGAITQGNAAAMTLAEVQLNGGQYTGGVSDGDVDNTSSFTFTAKEDGTVELTFDILGLLTVESDDPQGFASASYSWGVQLFSIGTGFLGSNENITSTLTSSTDWVTPPFSDELGDATGIEALTALSQWQISVSGAAADTFGISFTDVDISADLSAGTEYRFEILQSSNARGTVPSPASLALFSIGLLGLGAAARRKRSA